ncbi:MAG: secondary thiamine-phosphate synthase enzyme YjbQ [Gammaproteobacteria bacterium]
MVKQETCLVETRGRGTVDVTDRIAELVRASGIRTGLVQVFVHHTSASLIICENADPAVRRDLESFLADLAPDGDPRWEHDAEGPDDMPAHIRSILTQAGLSIPVIDGRPGLGTWQGVYLYEPRAAGHRRRLTVTVYGEPA